MSEPTRRPVPAEMFGGRLSDCYLLDLAVVEVRDRRPSLRSIRFGSPDLVDFTWLPGQDVMLDAPGEGAVRRRYTIRRGDPVAGTLDIEVVLHGTGPFARWASHAAVGDRIQGIGPRGVVALKPDATHHLFVGDESAEPAIDVMTEAIPPTATATAVLGAEADVVDRLRTVPLPAGTVAYLFGESGLVRAAADVLVTRGLVKEAITTKAYWRRDRANESHGEPSRD
jgi:NADPH-dependent ferric siderophore reductase